MLLFSTVNAWLHQLSVDTKRLGSFPATGSYCSFAYSAFVSFRMGCRVGVFQDGEEVLVGDQAAFLNSVGLRAALQFRTLTISSRRLRNAMISAKPTKTKAYGRRYRRRNKRQPPRKRMSQGNRTNTVPSRYPSTCRS